MTYAWTDWLAALAAAIASGVVSPLIVQRKWAFLGEAIGHSGFGGAGVIWLLASLLPGLTFLRTSQATAAGVVLAALAVALGIGLATGNEAVDDRDRAKQPGFDVFVGLFLVGTLALGLLAQTAYEAQFNAAPVRGNALLFGGLSIGANGVIEAVAAGLLATSVVVGLICWRRDVLAWCIDPTSARLQGINTTVTRLGLLVAVAAAAALASRLVGVILVTALLVIPGATGVRIAHSSAVCCSRACSSPRRLSRSVSASDVRCHPDL